jgi:hypothetical protein
MLYFIIFQFPDTEEEWEEVAKDYMKMWNFPHCIGALDGKHIVIRQPASSGAQFYNYKHTFSIILLALVDAHNRFIFIDLGAEGRCSDGGMFRDSHLNEAMTRNTLGIPKPRPLEKRDEPIPFFAVADDAFPLKCNIMKPYPHRNLGKEKRIFNYRLSRARRCVENAFGTMASRFRVFLSAINLHPTKVDSIVLASCALHNLLRTVSPNAYSTRNLTDVGFNKHDRLEGARVDGRRSATNDAKAIRDYLCDYVNSAEGAVSWQNKMA